MNVLLFGEYSGLHNNLKVGLEKLGHSVKIAASGDGFKNLASDISLGCSSPTFYGKMDRLITPFLKLDDLKGFDVTQYINTNPLTVCKLNQYLYSKIMSFSPKNYVLACGDDPVFYQNLDKFRYNPYSSLEDTGINNIPNYNRTYVDIHDFFLKEVDGIIPVMIEYAEGYKKHSKLEKTIPLPIDTEGIKYAENVVGKKVHFFHGLNRTFFKGTPIISAALDKLKLNYPNDVEVTIAGNMSQKDYLNVLNSANVVLDQCKGYSYGMNALYAMAKGKIVMSGSELEALNELNISKENCPIINIQPDFNQIYEQLTLIVEKRDNIKDMGQESREFVQKYHDSKIIAEQYIEIWQK